MSWVFRIRAAASVQITDLTRLVPKDPAVVLISTGANRDEWICVQECCEKANGVTFAQAAEHVVSQRHNDGVSAGFASRVSKAGVALQAARKEFGEPGPGVWRFPARLVKRPGVEVAVAEVIRRHGAEGCDDFDKLSRRLGARLRKYDKEERRRVKMTWRALEEKVSTLQQKAMGDPSDDKLQALLTNREAMLERYWDGRRNLLQTRMGLKVQLNGEAPTALLSALVKIRKAKSGIKELVRNGVSHTEAREILAAATSHFAEAFDDQAGGDEAEPWELLKKPVMNMVEQFVTSGKLPEVANEAVTILLYKKGEETDVRNYRPITLLTSVYKILSKVMATRMKAVLDQVISKEQFGFLPSRRLTDAVPLVADLIETAKNEGSDWYLLLIDFEKAYDSIRRDDTTLLLEGEAELLEAGAVLQDFAAVSGLKVNAGKSAVLPLGKNVGEPAPAGLGYKWVEKEMAERLLGVWITPGGNAEITWEKAFDRAAEELSKWQVKYLTTGARVTIINSYIIPIFLFQAQVYPPDDLLWRRVEKLIENFVSGNHADTEKHFRLWSGGLIYAPRELGGLGVIDPRGRIDSVALRCVGLTLLQECSLRRGLAERAAGLPLGWATLYAHKAVLKGGLIQSRRWARICKAVLKSTVVKVREAASRWEVAEEFLCFNRRIIHRGNAPFGGQKGTEKLRKWKMQDMVSRKWDGTVVLKSKETLERELGGGGEEAEMALKAFAAASEQWRRWLLAPLTADKVAAESPVVSTKLPGGQRCLWEICTCMGRKVELCGLDGNGERTAWKVKIVLGCDSVVPVAFSKSRAVREIGDGRTRLLGSTLFEEDKVAPLKRLTEETRGPAGRPAIQEGRDEVRFSGGNNGGGGSSPDLAGEV
ncbi:unnamed protein product [Closterium sp. Yama58-4]|nr:unnamed protein product [Closterium sp. Yama58-4]